MQANDLWLKHFGLKQMFGRTMAKTFAIRKTFSKWQLQTSYWRLLQPQGTCYLYKDISCILKRAFGMYGMFFNFYNDSVI